MPGNNISILNDPVLTQIYQGYMPMDQDFVRPQVMPVIPVGSDTGDIKTMGSDFLRIHTGLMVDRAGTPEIDVTITKANAYRTERHGLKIPVTKEDGKAYNKTDWRAGMRAAQLEYTQLLKTAVLVAKDYALASVLQSSSVITQYTTLSGSSQFNDYTNSSPIEVIKTGRTAIYDAVGYEANVAIMNRATFEALRWHPELKKTNGIAPDGTVAIRPLTQVEVAYALNVDRIVVGRVKYNTAAKGKTASLTTVWGKDITLAYINPSPTANRYEYSMGYTFEMDAPVIDTYEEIDPKYVSFVRMDEEYDDVILAANACYLIKAAIA
jgi:hypothetical protein